jgi:PepSY-associated TM region
MSKKVRNFARKYHKWPSIVLAFFIILFAFSGIVMNHRQVFSGIDISRKFLPKEFRYKNWNNHAIRGNLDLNDSSMLVYGNVGIWKTDSTFRDFSDFNQGFKDGIDNKKIYCLAKDNYAKLYAGTYFGLFYRDTLHNRWEKIKLDVQEERIASLEYINDTLFVLTRSEIIIFSNIQKDFSYTIKNIPAPDGFISKTPLFRFLWIIHSGEIFGIGGQLFVDLLGLLTIFLTLSGLLYFFTPKLIKKLKKGKTKKLKRTNKFSIKWHNKLGIWFVAFLILLALTGMFLRPPLLITIANSKIGNPPFTKFDSPNPWYDKLRVIKYDDNLNQFILHTSEGFYTVSKDLTFIKQINQNVPVSIMGLNVFEEIAPFRYLVGSFSGLYIWELKTGFIYNYFTGNKNQVNKRGNPFGTKAIQGFIETKNNAYAFDYSIGAIKIFGDEKFPIMPEKIRNSQMSLWNLCLEIHTGRIFQFIFGPLYILYIPLMGISIILILITGLILWLKKYN